MAEPKSFLATVKAEIDSAFATVYDELSPSANDEEVLGTSLITLKKTIWAITEKRLKESFQNGRKAGGNGADRPPKGERKPNPFRKE